MNITARIGRAMQFNCPTCDVGVGSLCLNKLGQPMARFVHYDREPWPISEFDVMRVERWLRQHADLLIGDK